MRNISVKVLNFLTLSVLMPYIYGCQGGGGSSASLLGGETIISGGGSGGGGGDIVGTIHNPEPTTMLLLGSGLLAMAYSRNKKNSK